VAIAEANHSYTNVKRLKDLPRHFVKELEVFFVDYHRLEGKVYKLLGCKGIAAAQTLIKQAQKAA
jgi:inorganic pyrophosphatase